MYRKLVSALVAPLLFLAACGDDGDATVITADDAIVALRAAPEATADAGSAHFEMVMEMNAQGMDMEVTSTGAMDAAGRMAMTIDFGESFSEMAEEAGEQLPDGLDEPMEMVSDGEAVYMRMPMLQELTGHDGWLSVTPEEMDLAGGSLGMGQSANDPTQMLEMLRGISDDLEAQGSEEVRGVDTTRFQGTIDLAKAIEQAPADQRGALEDQMEDLGASMSDMPIKVWVDDDGLVRRFQLDMSMEAPGPGGGLSATMTMEMFDFGEPVDLEIPDASEVKAFSDVMGDMGGAAGFGA